VRSALIEYSQVARAGDGQLVLISGEAGVRKSTLVEQLALALPEARWLSGGCDGLSTPRPLGPLFDIAVQLGGDLLAACRAGGPREQLFSALLSLLDLPGTVTVVALEDIHWADEATLDLLRFLARRVRGVPVLLIATYRDDALAADDPLRVVLGDLVTHRTTRRVNVAPLSQEAVSLMACDCGIPADELFRLTGGNPFFVTEIIQAGSGSIPQSARDAALSRVGARPVRVVGAAGHRRAVRRRRRAARGRALRIGHGRAFRDRRSGLNRARPHVRGGPRPPRRRH
jgi:predicted ATPase